MKSGKKHTSTQREEVFVGSLDAEALYPSLDATLVAKLCGDLVANKELKIENVDYLWTSVYLACTMMPKQVPRERIRFGGTVPAQDTFIAKI